MPGRQRSPVSRRRRKRAPHRHRCRAYARHRRRQPRRGWVYVGTNLGRHWDVKYFNWDSYNKRLPERDDILTATGVVNLRKRFGKHAPIVGTICPEEQVQVLETRAEQNSYHWGRIKRTQKEQDRFVGRQIFASTPRQHGKEIRVMTRSFRFSRFTVFGSLVPGPGVCRAGAGRVGGGQVRGHRKKTCGRLRARMGRTPLCGNCWPSR